MQGTTTELLLMLVLVTLSAFFSATETAYSSLNRARLKSLADRGQKRAADTLALADLLLHHEHDLIRKATGWMLREVGKKDKTRLCRFLDSRYRNMPRTTLRYAIERFTPEERKHYMQN